MKWYRLQEKDSELRFMDNDTLLVTDRPKVIWELWYGYETCDVYEVIGTVLENRTEEHEYENGNKVRINAPVVKVKEIRKVAVWKYGSGV